MDPFRVTLLRDSYLNILLDKYMRKKPALTVNLAAGDKDVVAAFRVHSVMW